MNNRGFYNLYSTPTIIGRMKSITMRLSDHATRMGWRRLHVVFGGKYRWKGITSRTKTYYVCIILNLILVM
jgi:hypothetical protein